MQFVSKLSSSVMTASLVHTMTTIASPDFPNNAINDGPLATPAGMVLDIAEGPAGFDSGLAGFSACRQVNDETSQCPFAHAFTGELNGMTCEQFVNDVIAFGQVYFPDDIPMLNSAICDEVFPALEHTISPEWKEISSCVYAAFCPVSPSAIASTASLSHRQATSTTPMPTSSGLSPTPSPTSSAEDESSSASTPSDPYADEYTCLTDCKSAWSLAWSASLLTIDTGEAGDTECILACHTGDTAASSVDPVVGCERDCGDAGYNRTSDQDQLAWARCLRTCLNDIPVSRISTGAAGTQYAYGSSTTAWFSGTSVGPTILVVNGKTTTVPPAPSTVTLGSINVYGTRTTTEYVQDASSAAANIGVVNRISVWQALSGAVFIMLGF